MRVSKLVVSVQPTRRTLRRLLLLSSVALCMSGALAPAWAEAYPYGGAGGGPGGGGGGLGYLGVAGGAGRNANVLTYGGGGGGGGGSSGGGGGTAEFNQAFGGAGGIFSSTTASVLNGQDGESAIGPSPSGGGGGNPGGGGGGGGAAHAFTGSLEDSASITITTGGSGGNGGNGYQVLAASAGGGGGGGGGYALSITSSLPSTTTFAITGTRTGGNGGNGGSGNGAGSVGGMGGVAGGGLALVGVSALSLTVDTLNGGTGGTGGIAQSGGAGGSGGTAFYADLTENLELTLTGLNGGIGGTGGESTAAGRLGGLGGNGGFGAHLVISSDAVTRISLTGTSIAGGNGGVGGNGDTLDNGNNGGDGGEGGMGLSVNSSAISGRVALVIDAAVTGGHGGNTGTAIGGDGGALWPFFFAGGGGAGMTLASETQAFDITVNANVAGGNGGNPQQPGGFGGNGGTGILIDFSMASHTLTIADGVTVAGGNGGYDATNPGSGGSGIVSFAPNTDIVLQGASTVSGGYRGDGVGAAAITFYGSQNSVTFEASATGDIPLLLGSVVNGLGDTFRLGGTNAGTFFVDVNADMLSGFQYLEKTGTSTWTLTGTAASTVMNWEITEGALSISDFASLGSEVSSLRIAGGQLSLTETSSTARSIVFDGGTLSVASGQTATLTGTVSSNSDFTKAGDGTLVISGNAAGIYGFLNVDGGTLQLQSTIAGGGVSVNSGGTLSGAGSANTVFIREGGTLEGAQGNSLSMGALILESGSIVNVTLDAPSETAVFQSQFILTTNGTLNVTAGTNFGDGLYRIFSTPGSFVNNGLVLGTMPETYTGTLVIGATNVDLEVTGGSGPGPGELQYWSANGTDRGGSGEWTASNVWLTSSGTSAGAWAGGTGIFDGTGGTVTVVGSQAIGTLEFMTSDFVLAAGAGGELVIAETGRLWAYGSEVTATISAPITGAGQLEVIGQGTIVLTGNNSYAGGTLVRGATLEVSSDANLGAASGGLTLAGGTLSTTASFTSARAIALGTPPSLNKALSSGGGTFQVADGTVLTLSGVISGEGTLTKTGTGTLVLTGENTYSGLTTISAGTLQLGNGGTTGSITGDVVNNASLVFNRSDTYSFPGTISGSGTVTFTGGGTVLFETPGAYSGPISVSNATLTLESGSQSGSVFTVGSGGLINGNGQIGGLVVNGGGIAAPGNSPGTISVAGSVAFNDGAVYRVDVTPAGAHDLITASGSVTLSSGASVQVVAERGVYAANATYAIVTTTGTVAGTFGSVTSDYAFLTPSLSYDAQNVYLTLAYEAQVAPLFATYAQTPNQLSTAVGAQALGLGNGVFDALLTQSAATIPGALNALSGEAYASVDTVIQQQSVYVREAVGSRLRASVTAPEAGALGYAAQAGAPQTATLGGGLTPTLWAQGYGGWGNSFSNGNAASITNSLGGFLIGADVALAPHARAGLFGGFSQSQFDVTDRASSGSIDNYDLGAYAGAQFGAWALRGGVSYTWHDVSMTRAVAFAGFAGATEGGYTSGTTQVFGEVGYDVAIGAIALEPFAGLAYVNVSGGSLFEGGGSAAALSVDLEGMSTLYSTLGIRAATALQLYGRTLTPSVTLGWQHAFGDTTPVATMLFAGGTTPFQVSGVPIAEDALLLGAGLSFALSDVASLGVTYSGQLAATASQNAFTAQFALKF
ncbi:autotransporter domain-containing protein [Aquabacter spiritensis]|uniref:Outer membrane autotransporter protein n=1 Tax=Aquabacter spiritensis TaxID=933073 RepID=A0A4R3LNG0_9HYPH|nr:autotransporter domain-containing protein [Aquabacter spiritensis]TCT01681.1 outer membrane autotransporter protein [Aquabacter spiritensis]